MAQDLSSLSNALKNNSARLLARKNVVATGIGYKTTGGERIETLGLVCSVTKKQPVSSLGSSDLIPGQIEGHPTDVVETGRIRALQATTDRFRPAPGGVSIGHFEITAGTLGCLVKKNGQLYILSNNHVLANSNDAATGDPILQPGPHDGGLLPDDQIAELAEFVPIHFAGDSSDCSIANSIAGFLNGLARIFGSETRIEAFSTRQVNNLVDAALARPLQPDDVTDEIFQIGAINGSTRGDLGMAIKKSGRTTGLTSGEILQVDVTANVQYGAGRTALFTDQLMAGAMSQGGDSGSAVLDEDNRLLGLLFAGSDQSTIINRIENVFTALGVSL